MGTKAATVIETQIPYNKVPFFDISSDIK